MKKITKLIVLSLLAFNISSHQHVFSMKRSVLSSLQQARNSYIKGPFANYGNPTLNPSYPPDAQETNLQNSESLTEIYKEQYNNRLKKIKPHITRNPHRLAYNGTRNRKRCYHTKTREITEYEIQKLLNVIDITRYFGPKEKIKIFYCGPEINKEVSWVNVTSLNNDCFKKVKDMIKAGDFEVKTLDLLKEVASN